MGRLAKKSDEDFFLKDWFPISSLPSNISIQIWSPDRADQSSASGRFLFDRKKSCPNKQIIFVVSPYPSSIHLELLINHESLQNGAFLANQFSIAGKGPFMRINFEIGFSSCNRSIYQLNPNSHQVQILTGSSPNGVGDFWRFFIGQYAGCQGRGAREGPRGRIPPMAGRTPWAENIAVPFPPPRLGEEPNLIPQVQGIGRWA